MSPNIDKSSAVDKNNDSLTATLESVQELVIKLSDKLDKQSSMIESLKNDYLERELRKEERYHKDQLRKHARQIGRETDFSSFKYRLESIIELNNIDNEDDKKWLLRASADRKKAMKLEVLDEDATFEEMLEQLTKNEIIDNPYQLDEEGTLLLKVVSHELKLGNNISDDKYSKSLDDYIMFWKRNHSLTKKADDWKKVVFFMNLENGEYKESAEKYIVRQDLRDSSFLEMLEYMARIKDDQVKINNNNNYNFNNKNCQNNRYNNNNNNNNNNNHYSNNSYNNDNNTGVKTKHEFRCYNCDGKNHTRKQCSVKMMG